MTRTRQAKNMEVDVTSDAGSDSSSNTSSPKQVQIKHNDAELKEIIELTKQFNNNLKIIMKHLKSDEKKPTSSHETVEQKLQFIERFIDDKCVYEKIKPTSVAQLCRSFINFLNSDDEWNELGDEGQKFTSIKGPEFKKLIEEHNLKVNGKKISITVDDKVKICLKVKE